MFLNIKNEIIVLYLEYFAMLNQLEENDRYLLNNHFTANVIIIIIENYKKFHDKMNKKSSTTVELKKLILKNPHD